MYAAIPYFRGSHNSLDMRNEKNYLEEFFSYFTLTSE